MDTDGEFLALSAHISIRVAFVRRRQATDKSDKMHSQAAVAPTAMSLASSCKSREGQLERHVRLFLQIMQSSLGPREDVGCSNKQFGRRDR